MTFILHAGFHKTATTHIQHMLEANSDLLLQQGVSVVPHLLLRKHYTKVVEYETYRDMGVDVEAVPTGPDAQASLDGYFEQYRNGKINRLVFSEENIIGHVGQVAFNGDFYQAPKKFAEKFRDQLPVQPTDILLSVRNYAQFFASCYVEHIGSASPDRFVMPEVMVSKVLGNMPNWQRLIDLFCTTFPNSRIFVWRYEDFRGNYATVMKQFVGEAAQPMLAAMGEQGQAARVRKSPGAVTMDAFLKRVSLDGLETGLKRWREIKSEMEPNEAGVAFSPWTDQQLNHLNATYSRDWDAIKNDSRITVLA